MHFLIQPCIMYDLATITYTPKQRAFSLAHVSTQYVLQAYYTVSTQTSALFPSYYTQLTINILIRHYFTLQYAAT